MTTFRNVKTYKDLSATTSKYAVARDLEVLVYSDQDKYETEHRIEIWPSDDNAELPYIAYTIQDNGSLYFYCKYTDIHKELSRVEDLPLTIKTDKELRQVIDYLAKSLKA